MSPSSTPAGGKLVAAVLAGSWRRAAAPPLNLTPAEFARAAPLLRDSGAAALGWRRVAASPALRETPAAIDLHQAARILALEEVRNARAAERVALLLNDAGIEPLLFKGWAVARYYAEAYLRPYGDLDLCAPPGRYAATAARLAAASLPGFGSPEAGDFFVDCGASAKVCRVDLHRDLRKDHMPDPGLLFERSIAARVGTARVRLLSPEDHLRLVITHFFRHGGVRALGLCDAAAMLEAASPDFDWPLCLGDERRTAGWVRAGVSLAAHLLDCDVGRAAAFLSGAAPPPWLGDFVLREWGRPARALWNAATLRRRPQRWRDVVPWIRARWPNAVQASITRGGSVRGGLRLLHQATTFTVLTVGWCARLLSRPKRQEQAPSAAERTLSPR